MALTVLRNGVQVALLPVDENTVYVHKLMGEHKILCHSIVAAPADLQIGDYIVHDGEQFYINTSPTVKKINTITYEYNIVFEGEVYFLYNKLYLDEGSADFSYTGIPQDFLQLLVDNINTVHTGWSVLGANVLPIQTISFSGDSCRTALTKIAEAFGLEYRLQGRGISMYRDVSLNTVYSFEYGRGNGLYTLERLAIDRANLVTRVYGYGGRKNIGADYRSGSNRLRFDSPYLELNTELYGIREGVFTNDDICPQRTGTVSAVNTEEELEFSDAGLDFDINDHLIEGTVAKVVFKTGDLAGYEFEVNRYLNSAKKLFINPFTEETGYVLPNDTNRPRVGDTYTLVDIKMPQSYIDDAEDELERQTEAYIAENSVPRVTYAVTIDEKYMRDKGVSLKPWHKVSIQDADLGIDTSIRMTELSYPVLFPKRVTGTISDTITYTVQERVIASTINNGTIVKDVDLKRADLARRTAGRFREMQDLVFDADGYFDGTKLKPNSLETLYLSVGAKSQNFGLAGVVIEPNPDGDITSIQMSAGQLVHYEVEIEGLGYIWDIPAANFGGLTSTEHWYVYAKCNANALEGVWEVWSDPKRTEDAPGFYYFYVGILYAEKDGRRDFDFTNGMTYINGDTITTGKIKSLNGDNYFDLSQGQFRVGDTTSSLDWNVSSPNRLTIRGSVLQTAAGGTVNLANHRGAYSSAVNYYENDTVSYNGKVYINTTATVTNNIPPTNTQHWALYLEGGADGLTGPSIVFRGDHSSSAVYYNNSKRRDVVKRSGIYYLFKGNDATSGSFTTANWENFGAQFDSVATNLLLAENANIADWILKDGKITSQDQNSRLYGAEGRIHLNGSNDQFDGTTRIEGEGIAVTGQGIPSTLPSNITFNSNGEPVGAVTSDRAVLSAYNRGTGTASSKKHAVIGRSITDTLNGLGGYFTSSRSLKLYTDQIVRKVFNSFDHVVCGPSHHIIIMSHGTGSKTVTLPPDPEDGREIIIKRANNGGVTVSAGAKYLWDNSVIGNSEGIPTPGESWKFIYDGLHWQLFKNKH